MQIRRYYGVPTPTQNRATQPRSLETNSSESSGVRCLLSARRVWCVSVLLLALFLGASAQAASDKTLTWDPSPDDGVIGYIVYYGTASHNYTAIVTVGDVTSATIDGLVDGETYYFAVTALYSTGDESDFSNEATYQVPSAAPAQMQITPLADGAVQLDVTGTLSHTYQILATSDFFNWTTITTQILNVWNWFEYIDTDAANYPMRIYRLQDMGATSLAASAPAQLQISANAGVISLNGTGRSGHTYEILATTTADLSTWVTIGTETADNSGAFAFTDYSAPNFPVRLYRTRDTQP